MPAQYGYQPAYKPPAQPRVATSALALAAAGTPTAANPYGFQAAKNTTAYAAPAAAPVAPTTAAKTPVVARTPAVAPAAAPGAAAAANTGAPKPGGYDINTDYALQATNAFTGESDSQAQADALKQKQSLLTNYGDAGLAQAVLGDQTYATAAAQNPNSTVAQLKSQYGTNVHNLDEALNQNNLLYGGYRVTQEQQAANDYQSQLAQAASAVNSGLDTIGGNLSAALQTNQQARISAEQSARDRAAQAALAAAASGASAPVDTGTPFAGAGVSSNDYNDTADRGNIGGLNATAHLAIPQSVTGSFQAPAGLAQALNAAPAIPQSVSGSFQFEQPQKNPSLKRLLAAG